MKTLYQRLLGARFADLHPLLRRFHSARRGLATGRFRVAHGGGLLAWLLRLPPAGTDIPLRLGITPRPGGECWRRSFAGVPLLTRQFQRGRLLREQAGPFEFGLAVTV